MRKGNKGTILSVSKLTRRNCRLAIIKCRGKLYEAAKVLDVSYHTLHRALRTRWPDLYDVVKEQRGLLVDTAEIKLTEAVDRGEKWAVLTVLKTLGKKRGYTEKREVEHTGQASPIQITTSCQIDELNLSLEARREIVHALERQEKVSDSEVPGILPIDTASVEEEKDQEK